jgi:DNA-binding NtrC family response regulator
MSWIHVVILSHTVAGATLGFVLFLFLRNGRKGKPHLAFIAITGSLLFWIVCNLLSELWNVLIGPIYLIGSLGGIAGLLTGLSVYAFCEYFPEGTEMGGAQRRIRLLSAFTLLFTPLPFFEKHVANRHLEEGATTADYGLLYLIFGIWIIVLIFFGFAIQLRKLYTLQAAEWRREIRIFLYGAVPSALLATLFVFILPLLGDDRHFFLGLDASLVFMAIMIYGILSHRLLDIRTAALRLTVRFLVSFTATALVYGLFLTVVMRYDLSTFSWGLALFLSLMVLLTMLFGRYIQPRIDDFFIGRRSGVEDLIVSLFRGERVGDERLPLSALMDEILKALDQGFGCKRSLMFAADQMQKILIRHAGEEPKALKRLPIKLISFLYTRVSSVPAILSHFDRVIVLEREVASLSSKRGRGLPSPMRLFQKTMVNLKEEGYSIVLTLIYGNEIYGYVVLGERSDDLPYTGEDLHRLDALRLSIALAIRDKFRLIREEQRKNHTELEIQHLSFANADLVRHTILDRELLYRGAAMRGVMLGAGQAAAVDHPVLITGETGTGKELIARYVHDTSSRRGRPFVAINCAALPVSLWEDEIFGHVKGAFTDARSDRSGRIEEAGDGTLFLDEIGEMPPEMQAKLLRLLQERTFARLGGPATVQARCRFIFATNRDLDAMRRSGAFREDLFHRINVFTIHLPALRERREDIPGLLDHFIHIYSREEKGVKGIDGDALGLLMRYDWPGNVRELENVIIRALAGITGERITIKEIPTAIRLSSGRSPHGGQESMAGAVEVGMGGQPTFNTIQKSGGYTKMMDDYSRNIIEAALRESGGNRTKAAELLGISRNTLRYRMRELGLD